MEGKDWKSMGAAVRDMSGVWVLAVLAALSAGPLRFQELAERVREAGPELGGPPDGRCLYRSTLSQTLDIMQRRGLVERTVLVRTIPRVVIYELTERAHSLLSVMGSVRGWSDVESCR